MSRAPGHLRISFKTWLALALASAGMVLVGAQPLHAAEAVDFTVSPQAPVAGQSVTFSATGTRPSDSIQWDFERDGVIDATGATVQHTYPTSGQRTVLMRVIRAGNRPDDVLKTILVGAAPTSPPRPPPPGSLPNRPPVASFTFYPRQPLSGDSVEFVSTSSDAEDAITGHAWDLDGDGQFDDSTGVTAARAFSAPGRYTVGLRVTDARGATDVESRIVTVGARLTPPSELALMSPFPVVRIIGRSTRAGARIKLLLVRNAPKGAKVTVRCRGNRCGRRRQSKTVRTGRVRFRSFERRVRTGVRIQVFVTQRGKIGKYTSFTIRSRRPPLRRDRCLASVTVKPQLCPSS